MAETIDLLEPFRSMEGMSIEGELTVTLDPGAIAVEVGTALAEEIKQGLKSGTTPDGTPLPGVKDDTERRRGPGSRGYRTGSLANSYVCVRDGDQAVIKSSNPDAANSVFRGAEVLTDEALALPKVDEAHSRALRKALGDE